MVLSTHAHTEHQEPVGAEDDSIGGGAGEEERADIVEPGGCLCVCVCVCVCVCMCVSLAHTVIAAADGGGGWSEEDDIGRWVGGDV